MRKAWPKSVLRWLCFDLLGIVTPQSVQAIPHSQQTDPIQLGQRPFYLVHDLPDGMLKRELQAFKGPFKRTDFCIGHRGAALQFPEHTLESYQAAYRMGAGIIECDVTFTQDKELVCRHSQCDLHETTNILATPLAAKCSQPFTPAQFDPESGQLIKPASAKCCTSDITLAEFKTLKGKMEGSNSHATTVEEYMAGTPKWRTDLYSAKGTVMTHKESIELFKQMGVKMIPELKAPEVPMPFKGFTRTQYAQKMIDEYKQAGVSPEQVFTQAFNLEDIYYWLKHEPAFAKQAIYLDEKIYINHPQEQLVPADYAAQIAALPQLKTMGINYIAPPIFALIELDKNGNIIPSAYAKAARQAGLKIIAWTLERSSPMNSGGGWYYQTVKRAIHQDSDILHVLDILAQEVEITGIFTDWPATVTYYANSKGL